MKKHHEKKHKEGSAAEEAMESPAEEAAEGGMAKGGKAKAKAKAKKHMKVDGMKAKHRLDKPARKASGGAVQSKAPESTDSGITPSNPLSKNATMARGGAAKKK